MNSFNKCHISFPCFPGNKMIKDNKCSGGGAVQNNMVYINKLIISGEPGSYSVKYIPTIIQRVKSILGLHPSSKQIELMVRRYMLGEDVKCD